jgi:hypothetical protein
MILFPTTAVLRHRLSNKTKGEKKKPTPKSLPTSSQFPFTSTTNPFTARKILPAPEALKALTIPPGKLERKIHTNLPPRKPNQINK